MNIKFEPYWSNYLKQFDISSSHFQHIPFTTHKYCVIIEPRKLDILPLVIKNFMYLLQKKGWGLIIFHGNQNESFLKSHLKNIPNIIYSNLNQDNLTIEQYNHLLVNPQFWDFLLKQGCNHALIFQTDTLLFKDNIDDFIEYDYIGAPWKYPFIHGLEIGNGGLSLRNVAKMLEILNKFNYNHILNLYKQNNGQLNRGVLNEDIFFSYACLIEKMNIPNIDIAKKFSVETIYYHDPCGIHKPILEYFPDKFDFINLLSKRI